MSVAMDLNDESHAKRPSVSVKGVSSVTMAIHWDRMCCRMGIMISSRPFSSKAATRASKYPFGSDRESDELEMRRSKSKSGPLSIMLMKNKSMWSSGRIAGWKEASNGTCLWD